MIKVMRLALLMFAAASLTAAASAGSTSEKMPEKKAKAEPIEIGQMAPDFTLLGHDGKEHQLSSYKDKIVVLEWLNEGCPFVKHHYQGNMQGLQKNAAENEDIVWLSIVSSAPGKQGHWDKDEDCAAFIKDNEAAMDLILKDPDGKVGRLYGAKTTPHMFVLDKKHRVQYMGAIDDNSNILGSDPADSRNYVSEALLAVQEGKKVKVSTTQPYGCAVKYN